MFPKVKTAMWMIAVASSAAAAAPHRFLMQWDDSENIHIADQRGAINRRGAARVSLELRAGGRLSGVDTGKRSEHDLYERYSTDEEVSWTTSWTGTWALAAGVLKLDLVLASRTCKKVESSGGPPKVTACRPASSRVALACATEERELIEDVAGARRTRKLEVWRCSAASGELADTPAPWVFGKAGCVRLIGDELQKCTP